MTYFIDVCECPVKGVYSPNGFTEMMETGLNARHLQGANTEFQQWIVDGVTITYGVFDNGETDGLAKVIATGEREILKAGFKVLGVAEDYTRSVS